MCRIVCLLLVSICLCNCRSKKAVVSRKSPVKQHEQHIPKRSVVAPKKGMKPQVNSTKAYINTYSAIAKKEMVIYGIPASITLSQAILESGSGKGRLAVQANNHFGIKCHDWNGDKIYHDDDKAQECFRKYKDPKYSFRDHSLFLSTRKRYASLFRLRPDNYSAWARGLRAAGYATDKRYPQKLISLIERYKLYQYDAAVLKQKPYKIPHKTSEAITHKVVKGDTLYAISKRYNTTIKDLQKKNKLKGTTLSIGQTLIIKP